MKSPFKINEGFTNLTIQEQLVDYLKAKVEQFYLQHKDLIDNYNYIKSKVEEAESRLNFDYKLTISNTKTSGKIINAKVKLPFINMEGKSNKYPFFNIHIGKLINYKKGIKDPQVKIDAEEKIRAYIQKKYPFQILNADNQLLTFIL